MRISDWSSNVCSSDLAYLALVSSGVSAQRQVWMHGDTPPEALAAMKEATACVVEREEFYQQGKEILAGYEPIVGEPLARNAAAMLSVSDEVLTWLRRYLNEKDRKSTRLNSSH